VPIRLRLLEPPTIDVVAGGGDLVMWAGHLRRQTSPWTVTLWQGLQLLHGRRRSRGVAVEIPEAPLPATKTECLERRFPTRSRKAVDARIAIRRNLSFALRITCTWRADERDSYNQRAQDENSISRAGVLRNEIPRQQLMRTRILSKGSTPIANRVLDDFCNKICQVLT
jgi:hypothetical protein